ncbi:hypothetical protein J3E71DRAFT_238865 [Bipolaris maydis]|nr:hypothetical protein J3E71DRAFT_238865 [Bipolaris maydis]
MASSTLDTSFSQQPVLSSSPDKTVTQGSVGTFNHYLPPISEYEWDFGWEENTFPLADPYEGFEQAPATAVESIAHDTTLRQKHEDLAELGNEVQKLRHDISELHDMFCKRLDSIEKSIAVADSYVKNLVPWSVEVHEKYSQLLAIAAKQTDYLVDFNNSTE